MKKRELIYEDVKSINTIYENADKMLDVLSAIAKLYPMKSINELPRRGEIDNFVRSLAIKKDEFLQKLEQTTTLTEVKLTEDLQQLKALLEQYYSNIKSEVQFIVVEGSTCRINEKDIDRYVDEKHRFYAETSEEKERLLLSKSYLEILEKIEPNYSHIGRYENPLVLFDNSLKRFVSRVTYVKNGL